MKIEIFDYNPKWKDHFYSEKELILTALKDLEPVVEHIGSTSVEGLGAKNIIDIMVGLKDESEFDLLVDKMTGIGFTYYRIYDEVMPERRLYSRLQHKDNISPPKIYNKNEPSTYERGFRSLVNCHCVVKDKEFWNRHIAFRDYLRNNDDVRDAYYKLKKKLSEKEWDDRNDYTDAKTAFIKDIELKALKN